LIFFVDNFAKGNQQVIKNAQEMQEMLGGDAKKYFDFIKSKKMEKRPLNEIMDIWFQFDGK